MCIIVYKPAGTDFPSWETLKNCFENNPDGAGYMFSDEHGVHLHKGFMKWDDFKRSLKPHRKNGQQYPFVLHFRITTHGGTKPEMTQPFPLSDDVKTLKRLDSNCKVGVAHNGIIPMTSDAKKISDTALFIKDYLTLLIDRNPKYYKNPRIADMIEELINSKMCILSNDGHVELIGRGWEEENGIYYSNTSYNPSYYKYVKSYSRSKGAVYRSTSSWYDDYDMYDEADEESDRYESIFDKAFDYDEPCHYYMTGEASSCAGCKNEEWCFG